MLQFLYLDAKIKCTDSNNSKYLQIPSRNEVNKTATWHLLKLLPNISRC